ncbi:PilZ domain-containing protein [Marinobacter halodurans]|nr:PilZ domain-containing protein [Marinobacter halodurans]
MRHNNERAYIRHPADIPLEVSPASHSVCAGAVRNLSRGGLSFSSPVPYSRDQEVDLIIRCCPNPLHVRGQVVWCEPKDGDFEIGIAFYSPGDAYQVRMVEQICQIEQYRRDMRVREGRDLTIEQAAREWIDRYAHQFAQGDWSDE